MKRSWMMVLIVVGLPGLAAAASPSYTFVDIGYQHTDVRGVEEGENATIDLSIALWDFVHVYGGYYEVDLDVPGNPV